MNPAVDPHSETVEQSPPLIHVLSQLNETRHWSLFWVKWIPPMICILNQLNKVRHWFLFWDSEYSPPLFPILNQMSQVRSVLCSLHLKPILLSPFYLRQFFQVVTFLQVFLLQLCRTALPSIPATLPASCILPSSVAIFSKPQYFIFQNFKKTIYHTAFFFVKYTFL
jgi:hypothetical protein